MKKLNLQRFITCFVIALVVFSSCTKQRTSSTQNIDTRKVQEVLDFKGEPGARVILFNILNPAEKAFAFKKHIQNSYEKVVKNEDQRRLALEAIDMISEEMYIPDQKINLSVVLPLLGTRLLHYFRKPIVSVCFRIFNLLNQPTLLR